LPDAHATHARHRGTFRFPSPICQRATYRPSSIIPRPAPLSSAGREILTICPDRSPRTALPSRLGRALPGNPSCHLSIRVHYSPPGLRCQIQVLLLRRAARQAITPSPKILNRPPPGSP